MMLELAEPRALWLLLLLIPLLLWLTLRHARRGGQQRRWVSLGIRLVLLGVLIAALAGLRVRLPSHQLTVVFVLDVSDSIGADERAHAADWLRTALAGMPSNAQAAVVVAGEQPMIERLPSPERSLASILASPGGTATDLAAAVRLAQAVLPAGSQHRIVVLSDGRDTSGDLEAALRTAAAAEVPVDLVPIGGLPEQEVAVSRIDAPAQVRQGDRADITVHLQSTIATAGVLRVYAGGQLIFDTAVDLKPGESTVTVPVTLTTTGFQELTAEVEPAADTWTRNNRLATFVTVSGPLRVLVLEGHAGAGEAIDAALSAAGVAVERQLAAAAPETLSAYAAYDVVMLADVPASSLGRRMDLLNAYVSDLGRGLVVTGGEDAFGLGGYGGTPLEAALPVISQLRTTEQKPQVALGLTLDKSGSMGQCHGGLDQNPARVTGGAPKIDIAKEASLQSIRLLAPTDEVGIVAFDDQAHQVAELRERDAHSGLIEALSGLSADGGTNIYAGLEATVQMVAASDARVKHILLITDGWSQTGNFDDLLARLQQSNTTLSVVGAGGGAADFLRELAERGGGQYYPVTDLSTVPRIFLQETKRLLRSYVQEGDFTAHQAAASPMLDGLPALPPLHGYVATTARPVAQTVLATESGDPLLAAWQYGLGRAVAWTSDVSGRWSEPWLVWQDLPIFWAQIAKWTAPSGRDELNVVSTVHGDQATLAIDAPTEAGAAVTTATLIGPDGTKRMLTLREQAPGAYRGAVSGLAEGAHLLVVTQEQDGRPIASTLTGLVVGYSREYALDTPPASSAWEARGSGGRRLEEPVQAFDRTGLAPAFASTSLTPLLMVLAVLLLPVDIAVRRLAVDRASLSALASSLRTRTWRHSAPRPHAPDARLDSLLRRAEAVRRQHKPPATRLVTPPPPPQEPNPSGASPLAPPSTPPADTLARLREARQRARRK